MKPKTKYTPVPKTKYTVVLHPKQGYNNGGYGTGVKWRGMKKFNSLPDLLLWLYKVQLSRNTRKRPWESFQILRYKNWETDTLLFGYLDHETKYIYPSLTDSVAAV